VLDRTKNRSLEIVVVDNASDDNTASIINQRFPSVVFIQTGANLGYAQAVNIGLRCAQGRLIFLLNPDTVFLNIVVGLLADYLDTHPQVGMVAPRLVSPEGEVCVFAARGYPSLRYALINQFGLRRLFPNNRLHNSDVVMDWSSLASAEVPALGGAAMMLPRAVFDEIGYLDEQIPMYFEDLDLCQRTSLAGKKLCYVPAAELLHYQGQSADLSPNKALLLQLEKGQAPWLFIRTYRGEWQAHIYSAVVFLGSLLRLVGLGGLYSVVMLLRPTRLQSIRLSIAKAYVLLRWSLSSKAVFQRRIWDHFCHASDLPHN
jgi:GT2 family glycosyltransferase